MVLETMKNIHPIYNIKVDEERVVCVCVKMFKETSSAFLLKKDKYKQ